MAELVEYGLVVLTSSFVVAFSIAGYTSFTTAVSLATQRADYSSYVTLAYAAIEQGNSKAALSFVHTSLWCQDGSLSFGSPGLSASDSLPAGCNFRYQDLNGPHVLLFSFVSGALQLQVS